MSDIGPSAFSLCISLKEFFSCRCILLLTCLGVGNVCHAQSASASDSLQYRSQLELFDGIIGIENTEIINGRKYKLPLRAPDTHPFYNASTGAQGQVTYKGQPYFNLTLLYDVYSDELVVQWRRAQATLDMLVLDKANVESFIIYDHTFRNYRGQQARDIGIADGFYDVLFENARFTLLARREKDSKVEMDRIAYEDEDRYLFVLSGSKATPFRGMRNFNQALGGDKQLTSELQSFVNKNNLKIKSSDPDLIATARYCHTLLGKRK